MSARLCSPARANLDLDPVLDKTGRFCRLGAPDSVVVAFLLQPVPGRELKKSRARGETRHGCRAFLTRRDAAV